MYLKFAYCLETLPSYLLVDMLSADACASEQMSLSCASNEVIIVTSARYGRMQLGGCINESLGHIGCYNDAMPQIEPICDGRSSCVMEVSNQLWNDFKWACPSNFDGYLHVKYFCKEGILVLVNLSSICLMHVLIHNKFIRFLETTENLP